MRRLQSKTKPTYGGYAKDQAKRLPPKPVKVAGLPSPPPKPLPAGLPEVLNAMAELSCYIRDNNLSAEFSVSVDYIEPEWVLICRGYEPPLEYWGQYQIKYVPSARIRPPLKNKRR